MAKGKAEVYVFQEENFFVCTCHPGLCAGVGIRGLSILLDSFAFTIFTDVYGVVFTELE